MPPRRIGACHASQDLLKLPGVREEPSGSWAGTRLDKIADWLAQRYLLKGVPFEALAPLADLLPPESVRFFYLDTNWLDALLEGALSIGIESSRDRAYQELMKDLIWDATHDAVQRYRDLLLGAQASLIPRRHRPAGSGRDDRHAAALRPRLGLARVGVRRVHR